MSIDFSQVSAVTIPEGNVTKIEYGGAVLWSVNKLPSEYQEVKYVQSDGDCYIDLNRVPNMDDIIEQKFMTLNTNNTTCSWYGSMPSSSTTKPRYGMGIASNGFFVGANNTVYFGTRDSNVHEISWQQYSGSYVTFTVDGETTTRNSSGGWSPAVELTSYLFARHGTSGVQAYDNKGTRIYYHREYTADGTLVMDLIPCYRKSDEVIGFYDTISETFLVNQGTGTLTRGSDIRLPDEYQEVKYIESDGSCYIDLLRVPNMDDKVEEKFMTLNTSSNTIAWYGSMPGVVTPRFGMGIYTQGFFAGANGTNKFGDLDQSVHTIWWQYKEDTLMSYSFDGGEESVIRNPSYQSAYDDPVSLTSYLFARHGDDGVQSYDGTGTRIYYHREYTIDGTLALSLIPCYRISDGEIGMYDLVSKTFLTNSGSGSFSKSADV